MQRAHGTEFLPQPTGLSEAQVELSVKKEASEVTICSPVGFSFTFWPASVQDSEKLESEK